MPTVNTTRLYATNARLCGLSAGLLLALSSHAAVFTVDSTENSNSVFLQGCTQAPGDCSFLGALTAANATPAEDTIAFAIPAAQDSGCVSASGVCQIRLPASIVNITQPIIIDGYTQAGASRNTLSADGHGLDTQLKIELLRSQSSAQNGLLFQGSATVRGIAFNVDVFNLQAALLRAVPTQLADSTQSLLLEGNYFGASAAGLTNNQSVQVKWFEAESGEFTFPIVPNRVIRIGGTAPEQRNWVLSGDPAITYKAALQASQSGTLTVEGNLFGTSKSGLSAVNNALNAWRWLEFSFTGNPNIVIGGSNAAARNVFARPVTAAINQNAVGAGATTTKVLGNYFGLGADGLSPLTVPFDPLRPGEAILAMKRSQIGGALPGEANHFVGNHVVQLVLDPTTASVRENVFLANTAFYITRKNPFGEAADPRSPRISAFVPTTNSVDLSYSINQTAAQYSYPLTVLFYKVGLRNNPTQLIGSDTYEASQATLSKSITLAIPPGMNLGSNDVVIASSFASADQGSSQFNWYPVHLSFVGNSPATVNTATAITVRLQGLGPIRPRGSVTIRDSINANANVCIASLAPSVAGPFISEGVCSLIVRPNNNDGTAGTLYAAYDSDYENFRTETGTQPTATRQIQIMQPQLETLFCDGFENTTGCRP